jgi:beta-lactamase regulating signal transducer with metallopeptidase domain
MKSLLFYLLQSALCSGLLYAYYQFFLRNKKFHHYNRFYLLFTVVISLALPLLNISVALHTADQEPSLVIKTLTGISSLPTTTPPVIASGKTSNVFSFTKQDLFLALYAFGGLLFLWNIFIAIVRFRRLLDKYIVQKIDHIYFINTAEAGTPFSFLRWLFWNNEIALHSKRGQQIFRHEMYHIEQRHSHDILFVEIVAAIFWVNPVFHLIKKEIRAIHEFLADRFAMQNEDRLDYAELLLVQVLRSPNLTLGNTFFHNQIKRRIAMITSNQKTGLQYLRKLAVLPVVALAVFLFAFKYKTSHERPADTLKNHITVMIDNGATDPNFESGIVADVIKNILAMNRNEKINILTTGNQSVEKKLAFIDRERPDIFISLRASSPVAGLKNISGAQVFLAGRDHPLYKENRILGFAISLSFVWNGFERRVKLDEAAGEKLLSQTSCPSAAIGIGYLSGAADLKAMKTAAGKEQIANIVLKAIAEYESMRESPRWDNLKQEWGDTTRPNIIFTKKGREVKGTINGQPISKIWMIKSSGYVNAEYEMNIFIAGHEDRPYLISGAYTQELLKKYPEASQLIVGKYDQAKEVIDNIPASTTIIADTVAPVLQTIPGTVSVNARIQIPDQKIKEIALHDVKFTTVGTDTVKPDPKEILIVIDNKIYPEIKTLEQINAVVDPSHIKSINVVKGNPATVKYGKKLAIEITTTPVIVQDVILTDTANVDVSPVFEKVEIAPLFPGGDKAWENFLANHLRADVAKKNGALPGSYLVKARFAIDKTGRIIDIKPVTNYGHGMEEELIRLLKLSPAWEPARQNGHVVPAFKTVEITFLVQAE